MIHCAGVVGVGDVGGAVGDISWLLWFRVMSFAGVVWVVLWVFASW